jgi:hypothetical protein
MRASRAGQLDANPFRVRHCGQQRRPGIGGAAEAVDHHDGITFAVDLNGHAIDPVQH